jgi:hypothetical protein
MLSVYFAVPLRELLHSLEPPSGNSDEVDIGVDELRQRGRVVSIPGVRPSADDPADVLPRIEGWLSVG